MDYSLLTEQQLQKKYYFLPENIKAVLDSENNMEIARQICRAHHLNDEEKVLIVEQLIGLILLGFVSADDLSREISENIHLNKKHADDISSEINRKIFALIKSDIDKIYAPAGALAEEKSVAEESVPPMEISEEHTVDLRAQKVEVKPPESAPLPEVKIAATEDKDKPFILHTQEEMKPTLGMKKSLGGLFGFSGGKEEKPFGAASAFDKSSADRQDKPKPVAVEVQIGGLKEIKEEKFFGVDQDKPKTELIMPQPPVLSEIKRKSFFKKIIDFFKSLFIKKEIYYKEVEISTSIEIPKPLAPSQPKKSSIPLELAKFQAIQIGKTEIPQPPKLPAPIRVVHYTELRTPLEMPKPIEALKPPSPAVAGEFIKIEQSPKYQPKSEQPKPAEEIIVDLRKAAEPKIEPKKQSGEMIDLSTMKKIVE